MIHYYYGYGKGKTTAAMGLALRALGQGQRVVVVQFLKDTPSGEITVLSGLRGATILRGKAGKGFVFQMTEAEKQETRRMHDEHLRQAIDAAQSGACDMVILDEVGDTVDLAMVDAEALAAFLEASGQAVEIVMTGHAPTAMLVDAADYVTEMAKVKHPYDAGVMARRGVEF